MNTTVTDVVMLVDDSRIDTFINKKALEKDGFSNEILVFDRATKALEYLKKEDSVKPGLILLDMIMPEMDGLTFLSEFKMLDKRLTAGTEIVMLSNMIPMQMMKHRISYPDVLTWMQKPLLGSNLDTLRNLMPRTSMMAV